MIGNRINDAIARSGASFCYRVLTHYESPGDLKNIEEGLEQMDAMQIRLLIIKGITDGNTPAARSQF